MAEIIKIGKREIIGGGGLALQLVVDRILQCSEDDGEFDDQGLPTGWLSVAKIGRFVGGRVSLTNTTRVRRAMWRFRRQITERGAGLLIADGWPAVRLKLFDPTAGEFSLERKIAMDTLKKMYGRKDFSAKTFTNACLQAKIAPEQFGL